MLPFLPFISHTPLLFPPSLPSCIQTRNAPHMLQHYAITAPPTDTAGAPVSPCASTYLTSFVAQLSHTVEWPPRAPLAHLLLCRHRERDAALRHFALRPGPAMPWTQDNATEAAVFHAVLDAAAAARAEDNAAGTVTCSRLLPPQPLAVEETPSVTTPQCVYELRPSLEAPLLRRLFYPNEFHVPPTTDTTPSAATTTPVVSRAALSAADRQALAHFFPAYHSDCLYVAVDEFVAHCRTDAHLFLCEGQPLTPLALVQPRPRPPVTTTVSPPPQPASASIGDDERSRFHSLYGRLHRLIKRHISPTLARTHGSADHCALLSAAVSDALSVRLAAALLAARDDATSTSPDPLSSSDVRVVCGFIAHHMGSWWRASTDTDGDGVPVSLRRAVLAVLGPSDAHVCTQLLAPLSCHLAEHLVSHQRRRDMAQLYEELLGTSDAATSHTPPGSKRPRQDSSDTPSTGLVELLLSLTLHDPLHRIPICA